MKKYELIVSSKSSDLYKFSNPMRTSIDTFSFMVGTDLSGLSFKKLLRGFNSVEINETISNLNLGVSFNGFDKNKLYSLKNFIFTNSKNEYTINAELKKVKSDSKEVDFKFYVHFIPKGKNLKTISNELELSSEDHRYATSLFSITNNQIGSIRKNILESKVTAYIPLCSELSDEELLECCYIFPAFFNISDSEWEEKQLIDKKYLANLTNAFIEKEFSQKNILDNDLINVISDENNIIDTKKLLSIHKASKESVVLFHLKDILKDTALNLKKELATAK